MNIYYHEFKPSFVTNDWFYFGIFAIALMIYFGRKQFFIGPKSGRIITRYGEKFILNISLALTGFWTFLLVRESHAGIIQSIDNHLSAAEDAVWSEILFPFAIVGAGVFFAAILLAVVTVSTILKRNSLQRKLDRKRERIERYRENEHRIRLRNSIPDMDVNDNDVV